MKQADIDAIEEVIRSHRPYALDAKAKRYVNKFFDRTQHKRNFMRLLDGME